MMVPVKLGDLFRWGSPEKRSTRSGPKIVRAAPLPSSFWRSYNQNPAGYLNAFKSAGIIIQTDRKTGQKVAECWQADNEAQIEEAAIYAKSFADSCEESYPIAGKHEAYPYQLAGCQWMIKYNGGILGDDMGLGKSLQLILWANHTIEAKAILLVCPPSLRINWAKEIRKFGTRAAKIITLKGAKKSDFKVNQALRQIERSVDEGKQVWTIIGDGSLQAWKGLVQGYYWDGIGVDEAHRFKNPETLRTRALVGEFDSRGNRISMGVDGRFKLVITGTPIENRPSELIVPLLFLDKLKGFGGQASFLERYCKTDIRQGWSNKSELNKRLRSTGIMIRRFKRDVQKQIPARRHQVILIEDEKLILAEKEGLNKTEVGKALQALKAADPTNHALKGRLAQELSKAYKKNFGQIARLRRKAGVGKLPHGLAHLDRLLEQTVEPIIVATIHNTVTDGYLAHLKKRKIAAVTVRGGMNDAQKDAAVVAFQDGRARVFIGQIKAAGVGLTLTAGKLVLFHEQDWTPGAMDQMADRTVRIGQDSSVLIQTLVVEGGLDSHMSDTLKSKSVGIQAVLDERLDQQMPLHAPVNDALNTPLGFDLGIFTPYTPEQKSKISLAICHLSGKKLLSPHDQLYGDFLGRLKILTDQQARAGQKLIERHQQHIPNWTL